MQAISHYSPEAIPQLPCHAGERIGFAVSTGGVVSPCPKFPCTVVGRGQGETEGGLVRTMDILTRGHLPYRTLVNYATSLHDGTAQ